MNDLFEDPNRYDDVELGISNSDMGMEAFKDQLNEVEEQEEKLTALLKKLEEANKEAKSITKASAMKSLKKRMGEDVNEVGWIALGIKAKLEAINSDNIANRLRAGCEKGTAIDRSRINMTNAVAKKFKGLTYDFQVLRQKMQDEHREIVQRRVITVTGTIPDEKTIGNLIETGKSEHLFQTAMREMGRDQVLATVEEIQERHDVIKEIERKLPGLQQIYFDLAILMDSHCEILDDIEIQVSCATEHVQKGTLTLQVVKKQQKRSRQWIFSVIVMLLVIAAVAVGSIQPWKRS